MGIYVFTVKLFQPFCMFEFYMFKYIYKSMCVHVCVVLIVRSTLKKISTGMIYDIHLYWLFKMSFSWENI